MDGTAIFLKVRLPVRNHGKDIPMETDILSIRENRLVKNGLVGSIRLKQVREGAEDYEYLSILGNLIKKADPLNPALTEASSVMKEALELVNIPCAMGRYSTKILNSPDDVPEIREQIAKSIEKLMNN